MEILSIIAFVIYILYVGYTITKHGYPESLSDTYYLYPKWVFPALMTIIGFTLLPHWLDMTEGSNFQFLSFLACVSFIFVGCFPDFKNDKGEYKKHVICAYLAAGFACLSIIFVMDGWFWLPLWLLICYLTDRKHFSEHKIFHLEDAVIMSVFLSI